MGFVVPSLADLCSPAWKRRAFGWVAADTFYYLTVARNTVRYGRVAYDQTHPNNGFHPLWQALCVGAAAIAHGLGAEDALVPLVVWVGVAVTAAAIPLLGRGLAASGQRVSVFFPLLPIGAYALLILPTWARGMQYMARQNPIEGPMPLYGTLWSQANGMESSLAVFFFALAGWIFTRADIRTDRRTACAFGLALSGLVLSRLDHVLLVAPLLGGIAISLVATRGWRGPLACLLAAFAAPIALYVVLNHHFYGMLVPVSGALKSGYPHVNNQNIDDLVTFWTRRWDLLFLTRMYRYFAAVLPAVAALLYLAVVVDVRPFDGSVLVRLRGWAGRYHAFLAMLAPGVVLLALYNILFVRWFEQGHWYFPASTLFVSAAAFSLAAPLEARAAGALGRWQPRFRGRRARWLSVAWIAACVACAGVVFGRYQRQPDYHRKYADFYFSEAPKVRAHYGPDMPRFVEGDDGIVAYSLGAPTMSTGMGLDPAGAAALRRGDLLEIALERQHDRLTSLVYTTGDSLSSEPTPQELRAWAHSVVPFDESKPYDFALDYRSADGHFAVVKARRR